MLTVITVASILGITALVWLANKVLPFKVCPICAGVFLTWLWLLGAYFFGYEINLAVPALLMGGTVVGIAHQQEKRFRNISAERLLLWKALFIPAGFVAAYSVLSGEWTALLFAAVFLALVSFWFYGSGEKSAPRKETAEEIEKRMKDCC
jgi:hypothetical protein